MRKTDTAQQFIAKINTGEAFSEALDTILEQFENGVTQQQLAYVASLNPSRISNMRGGEFYKTEAKLYESISLLCMAIIITHPKIDFSLITALVNAVPLTDEKKTGLVEELKAYQAEKTTFIQKKPTYKTRQGRALIGRDKDIAQVYKRLQREDTSLLTLHGSPGVGKTEIALQIYQEARRHTFFDRVIPPVSLELLKTASEVNPAIAHRMGVKPEDVIKSLQTGRNLLILDSCEHLLGTNDTASALFKSSLEELLTECETLTILTTSRRVIMGEKEHPVTPLPQPDRKTFTQLSTETLKTYTAIELFLSRAGINDSTPLPLTEDNKSLVASLCINLDGNPLAINLAASIANKLGLQTLLDLLNKREFFDLEYHADNEWHSSLDILLWSSYERLSREQKKLFRRLAVFAGECDLETAEAVCNLGDISSVKNCAIELDNWNLVAMQNSRIIIDHNIIRTYALHRLQEDKTEEVEIRNRHKAFYEEKARAYFSGKRLGYSMWKAFKRFAEKELTGENALKYTEEDGGFELYMNWYHSEETQAIIRDLPNFHAAYDWMEHTEGKATENTYPPRNRKPLWHTKIWGDSIRGFNQSMEFLDKLSMMRIEVMSPEPDERVIGDIKEYLEKQSSSS